MSLAKIQRAMMLPWRALMTWLTDLPIADPVDRANAPVAQIIFLLLLVAVVPLWFYRLVISDIPLRSGEMVSALMSAAIVVFAGLGLWWLRRGHFQAVLRAFLFAVAMALMASYVAQGAEANRYEAPLQLAWLVMAGLMLSRRALWLLFVWIGLAIVLGTYTDVGRDSSPGLNRWVDAVVSLVINVFVAVLVDRAATAFRRALAQSHAREHELVLSGQRLHEEMLERERIHQQLVHSQKVEVAGRLAAGLAHDFNHLLSLILSYRALASGAGDAPSLAIALDGIDSAAHRAIAISQRLLGFSGRGHGAAQVFDVSEALVQVQPMLRQLFGASVQLVLSDVRAALHVCMDRSEFELVVLNIAANAHAAMPQGGRFEISVAETGDGRWVEISLSDNGHGMDEQARQQALEPFFSAREGGTGLGLSVVADVIVAAGGSLNLESTPGHGTCARIRLPHSRPESEA